MSPAQPEPAQSTALSTLFRTFGRSAPPVGFLA